MIERGRKLEEDGKLGRETAFRRLSLQEWGLEESGCLTPGGGRFGVCGGLTRTAVPRYRLPAPAVLVGSAT